MSRQGDYREALNRIAKAKNEKTTELNLSNLDIGELPDELFECKQLTALTVSNCKLFKISERIKILANLHSLNAPNNQTTQLPSEIGALVNLQTLDVSNNQLTQIPPEIGALVKLLNLYVDNNQLTRIPSEIGALVNLQVLFVRNNQLTQIPSEIGALVNLQTLDVSNNQLTRIPPEIGALVNLQTLDVDNNQLTQIPSEIGALVNLQYLIVSNNQLAQIPSEIGALVNLQYLIVSNNQLAQIPSEIGALVNLQYLSVDYNLLTQIPSEIGALVNLKTLYVHSNQLTQIPSEIGALVNLKTLYVHSNQLTQIPSEIGALVNLQNLGVSGNLLTKLPVSMNGLKSIKEIYLHNNPSLNIPPDILGPTYEDVIKKRLTPANPKDILEYYFRTREGKRPLNEAKLILVGRGEMGKTSLVNRLVHKKFNKRQRKTDGIKISEWDLELKKKDKVRLNVWDFGGQDIMHGTHQFFLTERSLYLLVLDGRGGLEDNDAEYWLKLISSFGGNSPVVVVLNKINAHPFDLNRNALKEKYPFIKEFIKTDCEDNTGIALLLKTIKRETNSLENLRTPFPAVWFKIKEEISKIDENYLSFEQFKEFCKKHGEAEDKAHELLAGYLHQLGIALNYKDDPRLSDKHVLNPHWLTNGIYKILNSKLLDEKKGEITADDLPKILDKKNYPANMHCFLLDLLKRFELCFNFPDGQDHFLIPELLDKQEPKEVKNFIAEECLNFQYHYTILPNGLLPRFIVRTYTLSEGQKRWRSGVILQLDGCKALVKADVAEKKVFISIQGPSEKRRRLLTLIRSDFERIHADIKNLLPNEMVPIPGAPKTTILYNKLLELEKTNSSTCQEYVDGNIVTVNVRELLNGVDIGKAKTEGVKVFISYSHKDEFYKNQLETHLKILKRQNIVNTWDDRKIYPGDEWDKKIKDNLESADIICLLISADFLASDYCYDIEVKRAIERHERKEAIVIPIFIRKCNWGKAPFGNIQGLPKDAKPVKSFKDKDEAWTEISKAIEYIALNTVPKKQRTPSDFIKKLVKILPNDEAITVELEFETMLLCFYNIEVKNESRAELSKEGDNTNNQEAKYLIGLAKESIGKKIWASVKIFNVEDVKSEYEVKLIFKQNSIVLAEGELTTGKRIFNPKESIHEQYFIVQLIEEEKEKSNEE